MKTHLNFKIIGQGPPVIILHGLFGMLDNWLNMAKKLEEAGYMAILIDQRDHGRSDRTHDFSYSLLASDLYQFMEENWIHKAILIGHSMGGKTSLQFVNDHESMISKLIIVDIGMKRYIGGHKEVFDALFDVDLENIQTRDQAHSILMNHLKDIGTVQFLMKNLTRRKEGGFEWKMNLPLIFDKYDNILEEIHFSHQIDAETLFIRGDKSDYITDGDWIEIKKSFSLATLKTIKDAGHWIHVDQPIELFNTIIDFIKD